MGLLLFHSSCDMVSTLVLSIFNNNSKNTLYAWSRANLIIYFINGNAFEFYYVHLDDYKKRCRKGVIRYCIG